MSYSITTALEFTDEAAACDRLDELVQATGCFTIHREVRGYYLQPRMDAETKDARIDRILSPTAKLISAGWKLGPVGIECKVSKKKIGRCLCQAMDYSRAIWAMPNGFRILLPWIFIWPLDRVTHDLESVMAQNRIGWSTSNTWHTIKFAVAATTAFSYSHDGQIHTHDLPMGFKAGSR